MIKRLIVTFFVALAIFSGQIKSAEAVGMSFADYVYQSARYGRISNIQNYMRKGYNINAVNPNGMSALCQAVENRDYNAYRRLIQLGASPHVRCMERVDVERMRYAERRSAYMARTAPATRTAATVSEPNNTAMYAGIGLLAAGGIAGIIALNSGGKHHSSSHIKCPIGQHVVDGKCVDIVCPSGQHLVGDICVPDECPIGQHLVDGECVDIECPEGQHLEGDVCVPDEEPSHDCPVGQRYEDGHCVDIVCPTNTHLEGNYCVADEIDISNDDDSDVYGIYSDKEAVFNLYSSPKYPDDESSIRITNNGNGNVYGMYGYGDGTEVFNAYVIGKNDAGTEINPKPEGIADIAITDHGSGTVYGMYSHISDITQYKEAINATAWNDGKATANININHTGGGDSYGILGDVRAYNVFIANNGKGYGNIDITGDGNIYGIFGYVAATNVVDYFAGRYGEGNINLTSTGNGDVYGMAISKDDIPGAGGQGVASWFAFNAIEYWVGDGEVRGNINIHNTGTGNLYGMYGGQQLYNAVSNNDGHAYGLINIVNIGNGNSFGIYMPDEDKDGVVSNAGGERTHSTINIVNIGNGTATGLRGGKQSRIDNSGEIYINNVGNGTAIGIYGEQNSSVNNGGLIRIYRSSYDDEGTIYNPVGSVGGTAYGIYAESGATVENSGEIDVSGAAAGKGVYLQEGATLVNTGTIRFNGEEQDAGVGVSTVDLDKFGGGEIILGQGGKFFASSLKGNMGVAQNTVTGSFDDTYTLSNALQSNDVSALNTVSKSAMFNAKTKQNASGNYDVVLERKNFSSLVKDASVAQFLENNYKEGNNLALYDNLKTAGTTQAVNQGAVNYAGNDVLPSFRRENALVYSQLSRQFNDSLFNRPNEHYLGGYKYIDISRDKDGDLEGNDGTVHAAYGMVKGKADNGVVYGVGATVAQLKSDYDNHSKRKSNLFGLWLPVGYDFGNTHWRSKLYAGYEDGEYDRVTATNKFSSDINSYQYGLSNEIRHNIALGGGIKLTPAAELNLLGIYQKGFDEGQRDDAIHSDNTNSLSLEGGIGAYLSKEFTFDKENKLGIQIGGIYYVEFLDPDDGMDARINGMSGKYKISHKYDDDRAVLSARVNYDYRNMTLYGLIEQETGGAKGLVINAGLQYNL